MFGTRPCLTFLTALYRDDSPMEIPHSGVVVQGNWLIPFLLSIVVMFPASALIVATFLPWVASVPFVLPLAYVPF